MVNPREAHTFFTHVERGDRNTVSNVQSLPRKPYAVLLL